MAKLECQFFPGTPAVWRCDSCNTHYGEKCIPAGRSSHWGKRQPSCIRCKTDLRYLGSATGAKPFWQMLPHFFAYPLHPNSLLVIGLTVGLSLLFGLNLVTVFLALFTAAVVVKYGFAIIEHRGSGATTAPELGAVIKGDEHHLFLRQIAVFFLMGVAIGMAGYVNPVLGVIVGGFLTLAVPASTMLLAVEKSVRRALNPGALVSLMLAVGWPYLLLWLCSQIISAGPVYLFGWMAASLPTAAVIPTLVLLMVYFTFVLYAMLGYVLFEYQNELGFDAAADEDGGIDSREFEKARALGEAAVLVSDGDLKRARECLRRALDLVRDDLDLHMQYHKLLMMLDDEQALVNHCEYLVDLLKQQKQLPKAVPVVLDLQDRIPSFKLSDTDAALAIAKLLKLQGQYKPIVRLFHNLHKTNASDPLLPEAYLLVANVLFEYFNDDAKALAITQYILTKHPNCAQRAQFEQLHAVLSQARAG